MKKDELDQFNPPEGPETIEQFRDRMNRMHEYLNKQGQEVMLDSIAGKIAREIVNDPSNHAEDCRIESHSYCSCGEAQGMEDYIGGASDR